MERYRKAVVIGMVAVLAAGCSAVLPSGVKDQKSANGAPVYAAVPGEASTEAPPIQYRQIANTFEGSLWTPYNSRSLLFEDNKARNINDIVTVKIIESADASRNASTKLERKGGMKSNLTKFFGSPLDFGMDNLWGKKTGTATAAERVKQGFQPELESDTQNTFDGSGATLRKDRLLTTISATVVEVYPNGNMYLKGRREITINNEKQYMTLSGIVRPEDISPDNVVISTAIADAQISIAGKGLIADKQSPGFGHKAFDFIWPF